MKKLLFILVVILFSCERDETFCWECRRSVFVPGSHYSVMMKVCNLSESDIRSFERDNSSLKGTTTIDMTCWKEGENPIPDN